MDVMSSDTKKVCFNSSCRVVSHKWKRGWSCRSGDFAHLCDRCGAAYEKGKFCETFHLNESGWSCCESCGKKIHCGCIVSFLLFILLDAGGIQCLTCAKKSCRLTRTPALMPLSQFLQLQSKRNTFISAKTWSSIAGSGPVPWHQAPSLSNGVNFHSIVHLKTQSDVSSNMNRFRIYGRLSTASCQIKPENSYERPAIREVLGPFQTLRTGYAEVNRKEQPCTSANNCLPILPKIEYSSSALSTTETDHTEFSTTLSPPAMVPSSVYKHEPSYNNSAWEAQVGNGEAKDSCLLPLYHSQKANEDFQQVSNKYPTNLHSSESVTTPLFEKMITVSDAGRVGRLILPKKCAEAYFPPLAYPEGLPLIVQDMKGKEWIFRFRFSPSNTRLYFLEGVTPCLQSMQLQAGDVVTFGMLEPEGKFVIGGRKALSTPFSDQGEEATTIEQASLITRNHSAKIESGISVNSHIEDTSSNDVKLPNEAAKADTGTTWSNSDKADLTSEQILQAKPVIHRKRKKSNLGGKRKCLKIQNMDMIELKLNWKEAQGLMRPPTEVVPSVFVVEGYEFEEFEKAAPVIGRPTTTLQLAE